MKENRFNPSLLNDLDDIEKVIQILKLLEEYLNDI